MTRVARLVPAAAAALFAAFFLAVAAPAAAQDPIRIEITEVPYQKPYAFLRAHFEFGGKQELYHEDWGTAQKDPFIGFGVGLISARPSDIQFESNFSYQRYKMDGLGVPGASLLHELDMQVGGRYYPRYPTFGLGKTPVRLTFSALAGVGWVFPSGLDDVFGLSMLLTAGLSISSGSHASGVLLEFVYRPLGNTFGVTKAVDMADYGRLTQKPAFGFRIAWLFGPED
jgi:opacity protein-like surface antigen